MIEAVSRSYESLVDFAPDWVAIPGETIVDLLEERGWSQADLAARTGFTTKHVNLLLKGMAPINEGTALRLERVLGSTARFWLNLEAQYREHLARQEAVGNLAHDVSWLKELPLADMIRFGWVRKADDKPQQVFECLRYFGVASVKAWREQYERPVAAYRAAPRLIRVPAAVSAWLRSGERKAEDMRCGDYAKSAFEHALSAARALTAERDPSVFLSRLTEICAGAGVAVVVEPAPKGCPVSGATKWLSPGRALIMLSLRGKTDDKLWFSFFHEAGHLLKHAKRMTFLDILGEDGLDAEEERQADTFARDFLVPMSAYRRFVEMANFTEQAIMTFAREIGVSPGVVVGRLQYERLLAWSRFNGMKVRYRRGREA